MSSVFFNKRRAKSFFIDRHKQRHRHKFKHTHRYRQQGQIDHTHTCKRQMGDTGREVEKPNLGLLFAKLIQEKGCVSFTNASLMNYDTII